MTDKMNDRLYDLTLKLRPGETVMVEIPDKYPTGPGDIYAVTCSNVTFYMRTDHCDRAYSIARMERKYSARS